MRKVSKINKEKQNKTNLITFSIIYCALGLMAVISALFNDSESAAYILYLSAGAVLILLSAFLIGYCSIIPIKKTHKNR